MWLRRKPQPAPSHHHALTTVCLSPLIFSVFILVVIHANSVLFCAAWVFVSLKSLLYPWLMVCLLGRMWTFNSWTAPHGIHNTMLPESFRPQYPPKFHRKMGVWQEVHYCWVYMLQTPPLPLLLIITAEMILRAISINWAWTKNTRHFANQILEVAYLI